MKKLFLFIWFLLSCYAQATTLTGTIKNPDGTGVNGRISFQLAQQGAVYSTGSCPGPYVVVPTTPIIFTLTAGAMSGTPTIVGNDCIQPGQTYYIVIVRDQNSNVLFSEHWTITGTTVDVGTIVPTSTAGTAFSGAMLLSPPFNTDQSVASKILPDTTKSRDVGSEALKWNNVWGKSFQSELEYKVGDPAGLGGKQAISVTGLASNVLNVGDPNTGANRWTAINFYPGTASVLAAIDNGGFWLHPAVVTPTCTSGAGTIYFDGTLFQACQGTSGPTPMINSAAASTSLIPTADVTYSIGSPTFRWQNEFVGNYILLGSGVTDASLANPFYAVTGNQTGFIAAGANANASSMSMTISNGTCSCLNAGRTGSGTYLPMMFATNGAEQMVLTTTSQLYLGATTTDLSLGTVPWYTAIGNGGGIAGVVAATTSTNASVMSLSVVAGSFVSLNAGKTGSGAYLPINFETSSLERMRITPAGLVGVGTLSPDQLVTIETDQNAATYMDVKNTTAGTASQAVLMVASDQAQGKGYLGCTSSTFTTANGIPAASCYVASDVSNTGGLYLQSRSGPISFEVNSTTVVGTFDTNSHFILGATTTDISAGNYVVTVGNLSGFEAASASTAASVLSMTVVSGTYAAIGSNRTAGGSYLPLAFFTNATETMLVDVNTTNSVCVRVSGALHRLTLSGSNFVDGGTC
jgi:hypothetical protein